MTSADNSHGVELVLVNSITTGLLALWEQLGGLQTILILTAIIFNIVRVWTIISDRRRRKKKRDQYKDDQSITPKKSQR